MFFVKTSESSPKDSVNIKRAWEIAMLKNLSLLTIMTGDVEW